MTRLDKIADDLTLAQQDIPNGDITVEPGRSILAARLRLQHEHAPYLLAVVREVAGLHRPRTGGTWEGYCTCSGREWPCPTARALEAPTETKERNHEV